MAARLSLSSLVVLISVLSSCVDRSEIVAPNPASKVDAAVSEARGLQERRRDDNIVPGSYIVLLKRRAGPARALIQRLATRHGGTIGSRWENGRMRGFTIHNIAKATYLAIAREPDVLVIEPERRVAFTSVQSLPSASAPNDTLWYLDRIDKYGAAEYDAQYDYGSSGNTGNGVHIYIVDSGIRGGHAEFTGRIGNGYCHVSHYWGWLLLYTDTGCSPTNDPIDEGHGTGMAGLAAGTTLGVAKHATIHSVRINDDQGGSYCGDVAAGLVWVRQNAILPAVVNLSIDADCASVRGAAQDLITSGIQLVKAAGNLEVNANTRIINQIPGLIVVGGTSRSDARWSAEGNVGSSWGSLVNISAPGDGMFMATGQSNSGVTAYMYEGTSNSAALVTGVVARLLQLKPSLTLATLQTALYTQASAVTITDGNGMANRILFSGASVSPDSYVPSLPGAPNLSLQIEGYSQVRPSAGCYFYANASGGAGTYSYVWKVGDTEIGGDDEYLYYQNALASGSSFTVSVRIFDGVSSKEATFDVAVSSSSGECYAADEDFALERF